MRCVICGMDNSGLFSKKALDGPVCTSCIKKLPYVLRDTTGAYSGGELSAIIENKDQMRRGDFTATSSYGNRCYHFLTNSEAGE